MYIPILTIVTFLPLLGVAAILEGSVRRGEGRVRIVAQLIDTKTDKHLWAETYDRQLDDIFAIQSDVAKQIASALKVEMSPEFLHALEESETLDFFNSLSNSLQRYHCDLINKAKAEATKQRRIEKAIGLFKQGKKR